MIEHSKTLRIPKDFVSLLEGRVGQLERADVQPFRAEVLISQEETLENILAQVTEKFDLTEGHTKKMQIPLETIPTRPLATSPEALAIIEIWPPHDTTFESVETALIAESYNDNRVSKKDWWQFADVRTLFKYALTYPDRIDNNLCSFFTNTEGVECEAMVTQSHKRGYIYFTVRPRTSKNCVKTFRYIGMASK